MTTLRLELEVRDYDMWRAAFETDQGDRAGHGMRCYRIFRPLDDQHRVMLDSEFDDPASAERFLETMRTSVWPDPAKAPAKIGQPKTTVLELVESHQY